MRLTRSHGQKRVVVRIEKNSFVNDANKDLIMIDYSELIDLESSSHSADNII